MHERRRVQQLDRRRERDLGVGIVVAEASGEQRDRRPQPLAAAREDLVQHRLERHKIRPRHQRQRVLNDRQVVGDGLVEIRR